ncbi:MAG: hypothetical protein JW951_04405 [Lentisphaerae bacterium]|nr:hypothetical protein [Lentisphaerota bacterium]
MKAAAGFYGVIAAVIAVGVPARADLISLFTFDENYPVITNAIDDAPDGTLVNGPTNVPGRVGQALHFVRAHTNYVDMNIDTEHVGRPNTQDGAGGVYGGSMGCWIKTDVADGATIFSTREVSNGYFEWVLNNNGAGKMRLYLRGSGGNDESLMAYMDDNDTWRNGEWHHLMCTWTNTTGETNTGSVVFYVDGEAQGVSYTENEHDATTVLGGWRTTVADRMKIGAFRDGLLTRMDGYLDDLACWNTRFSSNEVRMLYELGAKLGYGSADKVILDDIYLGGPGTSAQTGDGTTWMYTAGLPPRADMIGMVINDGGAVIMDASGNGVRKAGSLLLSLLPFDGNADNAVSNAPGGTEVNGPTYVTGKFGQALDFDQAQTNYVDMVDGARPNGTDGGIYSGSIGVWIRTTYAGPSDLFSVLGPVGNNCYFEWFLNYGNAGVTRFYMRDSYENGDYDSINITTADIDTWRDGNWHHMLCAWRTTTGAENTGRMTFYLDGNEVAGSTISGMEHTSASVMGPWGTAADRRMKIGAFRDPSANPNNPLTGTLDEFAAWGVELSAIEAKALFELGNERGYDALDSQTVLDVFGRGPGAASKVSDGRTWEYRSGLSGTPGELNRLTLVLDESGNGVVGLPHATLIFVR